MRRRFTLIELLVVVAIIAILASMLLPVLGRAREMGRMSLCMSNEKQMGIGLTLYLDEHDDVQPVYSCYCDKNNGLRPYLYVVRLAPYLGYSAVGAAPIVEGAAGAFGVYCQLADKWGPLRRSPLFCPSESNADSAYSDLWVSAITNYGTIEATWCPRWGDAHYLGNPDWGNMPGAGPNVMVKRVRSVEGTDPAARAVFGHMSAHKATYLGLGFAMGQWACNSFTWQGADDGPNHNGSLPFAFLDDHVESLDRIQFGNRDVYGPNAKNPMWGKWYRASDGPDGATIRALLGGNVVDWAEGMPASFWDLPVASPDARKNR